MNISKEKIEEVLFSVPSYHTLLDILAPLEIGRLVDILEQSLSSNDVTSSSSQFERWSLQAKQEIIKQIEETTIFLGIKDLGKRLPLDELLKKIYETS